MKREAHLTGIVGAIFLILVIGVTAVTATFVRVEPASQTVSAGQNCSVAITVDEVIKMTTVGGLLHFDPTALQATRIEEGLTSDYVHFFTSENIDDVNGVVSFTYSLNPDVNFSGSGPLVTIHFLTNQYAEGTYTLSLTNMELYSETGKIPLEVIFNGTITIGDSTPTPDNKKSSGGGDGGSSWLTPTPTPTLTATPTSTSPSPAGTPATPSSSETPTATVSPSTPSASQTPAATTATPTPKAAGFELFFAIIGVLAVACHLRR